MSASVQFSHLIKLLDDESEVVREAVRRQLEGMRRDLPEHLADLDRPLTSGEECIMADLLAPSRREDLEDTWFVWRDQASADRRIESALSQISAFLSGWKTRPKELAERLDGLAALALVDLAGATAEPRWLGRLAVLGAQWSPQAAGQRRGFCSRPIAICCGCWSQAWATRSACAPSTGCSASDSV